MRGPPPAARGTAVALASVLTAASAPPALTGPASAQTPGGAGLDSVEAAVDSGRVEAAREELERWMDRRFADAPAGVRVRARLLQARLAEDPDEARRAYALVAVEGGLEGARARLRLAQLHLAEGRPERALEELATVRADVPGTALEAEAWLWTGRVREAEGEGVAACEAYRRAAAAAPSDDGRLREVLSSAREACRRGDGNPEYAAEAHGGGEETDGGRAEGRFAVQLGAFAMRQSAEDLRARAAEAGFDARLTARDPGDGLLRVRVGGFGSEAAAEEAAGRIEDAGFRAIVVEIGSSEDDS